MIDHLRMTLSIQTEERFKNYRRRAAEPFNNEVLETLACVQALSRDSGAPGGWGMPAPPQPHRERACTQAIETSERIFAMKIRVMATILKTVDNLADAVASCSVCIEELHCLSAVQDRSFLVLVKTGILDRRQALKALKLLLSKEDQKKAIIQYL